MTSPTERPGDEAGRTLRELAAAAEQAYADRRAAEEAAAEQARLRAEAEEKLATDRVSRQAVEASIRHHAQLVEVAQKERLVAERRVTELAHELADLRERVIEAIREKGNKRSIQQLELVLAALPTPPEAARPRPESIDVPQPAAPEEPAPAQNSWAAAVDLARTGRLPRPARTAADYLPADEPVRRTPAPAVPERTPEELEAALDEQVRLRSLTAESPFGLLPAGEVYVSHKGVLEIRKGARTHRFDLADEGTQVRVYGEPGQRNWKVKLRDDNGKLVVDDRLADPDAFIKELRRWRPEAF